MSNPDRVELRTKRLLLRPYRFSDVPDVLAYAVDEEWGRYLPVPRPYTEHDAEEFIAAAIVVDWATTPTFAIEHEGHVVGGTNLRIRLDDAIAEIGWSIAPWLWNQGLATEAAREVARWGFESRGLHRLYARADVRNIGSWRVMEKLGMQREGHMRQNHVVRGEYGDEYVYGILCEQFLSQRSR